MALGTPFNNGCTFVPRKSAVICKKKYRDDVARPKRAQSSLRWVLRPALSMTEEGQLRARKPLTDYGVGLIIPFIASANEALLPLLQRSLTEFGNRHSCPLA
ncbi:hypothetical protein NDU88_004706 [Pleurodeles waltl]|uniref:Uncharacterized protein n=1 Tax=Pleurodeles waltl TaxID=8319 RepID=A0AAV7M7W0_PLEWA|nr:hypothetical protein NDU88_004706 [Pleurodeles waltl]